MCVCSDGGKAGGGGGACLIALPLGAEGGDGGVGGLVVEHAARGRVVRVGEWGERFAGFAFKSGPGNTFAVGTKRSRSSGCRRRR